MDTCISWRSIAKAATLKKPQQNKQMENDQSDGFNMKMGTQINRNPQDSVTWKVEDLPMNWLLNKRVRTSVVETRAECRGNGIKRQPLLVAKDLDLVKDTGGHSDMVGKKPQIVPAEGVRWDNKMKRKRLVDTVFSRSQDNDGELKRSVRYKLCSETGLMFRDAPTSRLAGSSVTGGSNKLEGTPLPVTSTVPMEIEAERSGLPRDLTAGSNKEKILAKGTIRLKNRVDHNASYPSLVRKGKGSRTLRTSSITSAGSSPVMPRPSGTLNSWDHAPSAIKTSSTVSLGNHKHALSQGSPSPPMARWLQKMSRTRRSNLVFPGSNHDEEQISADGCAPSDFGVKLTSNGTKTSIFPRNAATGSQLFNVKLESVHSLAQLSEYEESGGCDKSLKKKGLGSAEVDIMAIQNTGSHSSMITKKNEMLGLRWQGCRGRDSFVSRPSISPTRKNLENATITKPLRSTSPGSKRNGSKSRRPLEKQTNRKGFSRLGHVQNTGSPDVTEKNDGDLKELIAAAKYARNFSHLACSSSFWKEMESSCFLSLEGKSYLSEQDNTLLEDISVSDSLISEAINGHERYRMESLDSELVQPLYQRVLSALIVEDDLDSRGNVDQIPRFQKSICNSDYDTCHLIDAETRKRARMKLQCDSEYGVQSQSHGSAKKPFSCTGSTNTLISPSTIDAPCSDVHQEVDLLTGISQIFPGNLQMLQRKDFGIPSLDCPYEHMSVNDRILLELQSVGLYPETLPNLEDNEDDMINQSIIKMKAKLVQQLHRKKTCLEKIYKATVDDAKTWDIEQVAMDRLVVIAYKKLVAAKIKGSKQVALGFARWTLDKCRKYEDSGVSCFSEPPLRDIIFAPPPMDNEAEPKAFPVSLAFANNKLLGSCNSDLGSRMSSGTFPSCAHGQPSNAFESVNHPSDMAFAINGPVSNRGKTKKISLDDAVGGSVSLRTKSHLGHNSVWGGTKGKRSAIEKETDPSTRNGIIVKAGCRTQGRTKGGHKTKPKPKQKKGQLSTSGNGRVNKFAERKHSVLPSPSSGSAQMVNNAGNRKRDDKQVRCSNNNLQDSSMDRKGALKSTNITLHDVDPTAEIGINTDIGGTEVEDLNDIFNFEVEDLIGSQENEDEPLSFTGLLIPMDDISTLGIF